LLSAIRTRFHDENLMLLVYEIVKEMGEMNPFKIGQLFVKFYKFKYF